jgi:hypothetical protein
MQSARKQLEHVTAGGYCILLWISPPAKGVAICENACMEITLPELESAINYWRRAVPATGEESRLCREASLLAAPYAMMIFEHRRQIDHTELGADAWAAFEQARA